MNFTGFVAYFDTNNATIFLVIGTIIRLVGKATAKPISHPFRNLWEKSAVQPVFMEVIVKVITVSNAKVMKKATSTGEYFLLNFKAFQHQVFSFICLTEYLSLFSFFIFC